MKRLFRGRLRLIFIGQRPGLLCMPVTFFASFFSLKFCCLTHFSRALHRLRYWSLCLQHSLRLAGTAQQRQPTCKECRAVIHLRVFALAPKEDCQRSRQRSEIRVGWSPGAEGGGNGGEYGCGRGGREAGQHGGVHRQPGGIASYSKGAVGY